MSTDAQKNGTPDEQRLLSGKRRAQRHRLTVEVSCMGSSGRSFSGRTADISRAGMLVDITDSEMQPVEGSINIFPFAARVAIQFPEGMDVKMRDGTVLARAQVVRLATKPEESNRIFLGCSFSPPLTMAECRLLGIDPGTDETKAPAAMISTDVVTTKLPTSAAEERGAKRPPAGRGGQPRVGAAVKSSWRKFRPS